MVLEELVLIEVKLVSLHGLIEDRDVVSNDSQTGRMVSDDVSDSFGLPALSFREDDFEEVDLSITQQTLH